MNNKGDGSTGAADQSAWTGGRGSNSGSSDQSDNDNRNNDDRSVSATSELELDEAAAIDLRDNRADAAGTDGEDRYRGLRSAYPPILSTAQVAELLDLNPRTVLNMAGDGRLPASRLPGSRKFHFLLEDIIATLEANRVSDE